MTSRCIALAAITLWIGGLAHVAAAECKLAGEHVKVAISLEDVPAPGPTATIIMLGYPQDLVALPAEARALQARLSSATGTTVAANKFEGKIRVVAARAGGLSAGQLVEVDFDHCGGAAAPTAAGFSCAIQAAGSAAGAVKGVRCTATPR